MFRGVVCLIPHYLPDSVVFVLVRFHLLVLSHHLIISSSLSLLIHSLSLSSLLSFIFPFTKFLFSNFLFSDLLLPSVALSPPIEGPLALIRFFGAGERRNSLRLMAYSHSPLSAWLSLYSGLSVLSLPMIPMPHPRFPRSETFLLITSRLRDGFFVNNTASPWKANRPMP
jgi:hypothetical protein